MANNRLYIQDRDSGDLFFLAKSFGGGWRLTCTAAELQKWLGGRDLVASEGDGPSSLGLIDEYEPPEAA